MVAVAVIALLLVLALISWRIDRLPGRLFHLVKQERAREDNRAQTALLEAAALKVGPLVGGIRTYHDQIAASMQVQIAEAEIRARVAERRALDASTYLGAASVLVSDLRGLRDELQELLTHAAPLPIIGRERAADPGDPDQRVTTEVRRPPATPPLPAAPAMVAARLIPRGASESARPEPRRTRSFAALPDARREAPTPPPAADLADSGAFLLSERPSDPEGGRTRVGPRPSPELLGLPSTKATLMSMPSIVPATLRTTAAVEIAVPTQGGAA
ncbi:MAG: hypothetical protein ABI193_05325 [Minicystis sp.]